MMRYTAVLVASALLSGSLLVNSPEVSADDAFNPRLERQAIGYQVENGLPDLRAGMPLRNNASGKLTEATGRVTVLLEHGQIENLAREFNLTIVYQDPATGIGQLDASNHSDLRGLLKSIRGSGMVRAARLEMNERKHVLHQLQR